MVGSSAGGGLDPAGTEPRPGGWLERHQVPLYLAGLALGAIAGLLLPGVARPADAAILPALALLLYVTFLGIPLRRVARALRSGRFLATIAIVNFAVVPVVALVLSRIVAHEDALLLGVLLVLLTPCVDYVIVFAGLAGGDRERLLAATPLLMLAQLAALPGYLWLFLGSDVVALVEPGPFVEAFVLIIALPLMMAWLTQLAADRMPVARAWMETAIGSMVPLMTLTLGIIVASQIAGVRDRFGTLLLAVPVYLLFALVMVPVGAAAARIARLDVPGQRAVVFSGVTRNSLVVLPLALALPTSLGPVPLVVVTQTLVELVVMIVLVRLLPWLMPNR
ncbi:arsenic resistance protein [Salana multivorans]